jgi:hypothetical protein
MLNAELRRTNPNLPTDSPPYLWIVAAEVSDRLLTDFNGNIDPQLGEGFYQLTKGLKTTIIAVEELPTTPETLWLRLMGKGRTQDDAIADLLMLPESDTKRSNALNLLVSWRINIEITNQVEQEERRILMALSQVYLEWEKQTKRLGIAEGIEQGIDRGLQQERRSAIESLMKLRFGVIDESLDAIIPNLMALSSSEYTSLLLQLPKEELIQHFQR